MRLSMRIWDLPTRSFHWLVTLLLGVSVVTQATKHYHWHILSGELLLVLLVWRVIWGFVGSETSRFGAFLREPRVAARQLGGLFTREVDDTAGHNAAGGWWVLVMLGLMGVQVISGLFNSADGRHGGPLFQLAGVRGAAVAHGVHAVTIWLLAGAIVVHLLVIAAHAAFKGQNLVRPMITGKKRMPAAMRAPRLASPSLAALVLVCAAGGVLLVLRALAPR